MTMSDTEMEAIISETLADIEASADDYFREYMNIFCYRGKSSAELAAAAFVAEHYSPSEIFYAADSNTRQRMIERLLTTEDSSEASEMMCALAVQKYNHDGGRDVLNVFLELEKNPKPWRQKLYVDPSSYAGIGGWTFDENGTFIKLVYDT